MENKKAQYDTEKIFKILIFVVIGIFIGYLIWGQNYTFLNNKYKQCQSNYQELNESYNQLEREAGELLKKYSACVDRETFFEWVDRTSSMVSIVKFLGLFI